MRRFRYQVFRIVFLLCFLGFVYYNFIAGPSSSDQKLDVGRFDDAKINQNRIIDLPRVKVDEPDRDRFIKMQNHDFGPVDGIVEPKQADDKQINQPDFAVKSLKFFF